MLKMCWLDLNQRFFELDNKKSIARKKPWVDFLMDLKQKYPLMYDKDSPNLKPAYVVEKIYEVTKGEAIICTEVGQNQMWAAQFYNYTKPRTFVSSGGLGTMGFGLPSAIGAKIGQPDKTVIDIAGDGSLQMVSQELATAVSNNIPVKIMLLNNGYLGMVRQWQELFFDKRYSHTCIRECVDFVKLIEAYGGVGIRVTDKNQVEKAIKEAINLDKVVLVDFWIEAEENVYPMVAPGASINEMLEWKY
ncbi:MAG: thiamine pyrophosphate-dependent enzyme [Actinomycetota bacterium]|nr:thiamine pyrophosphate-dependent enzyme [Actinomycetota bacterium]